MDASLLDISARKNLLFIATMDLLKHGDASGPAFELAMRSIQEARTTLRMFRDLPAPCEVETMQLNRQDVVLQPPLTVKAKGRPPTVRIKPRSKTYGNKKAKSLPASKQSIE